MKLTALHRHRIDVLKLGRTVVPTQPPVLVEFQTACANIELNPQMFPMLGCGKHQKRRLFTSRNRERRRERLRMMARTMAVLGGHADLLTLSDGRRVDGVCKPITELQIGRELGIEVDDLGDDHDAHDAKGMRAMRSALRDLDDGELISRKQPKVQYCSAAAGGCGKDIPRGRSCKCGRRHCWRWRSLPTVITIQSRAFEAMGLGEQLADEQAQRYADIQAGKVGPEPERDIRAERLQRHHATRQRRAAAAAGIESTRDPDVAARQREQLARLYGEKQRE
jgi:hypothetical protein